MITGLVIMNSLLLVLVMFNASEIDRLKRKVHKLETGSPLDIPKPTIVRYLLNARKWREQR